MKIKASKLTEKKTRVTNVTLILRDEETNEWREETTLLEYYTDTVGNYRSHIKLPENENADGVMHLSKRIASFPEVIGDDEQALTDSAAIENFLATLHAENIGRIHKAIADDMSPEKKSL
jgi:hypothetical protein